MKDSKRMENFTLLMLLLVFVENFKIKQEVTENVKFALARMSEITSFTCPILKSETMLNLKIRLL